MLIGNSKCGTSSIVEYMQSHPQVIVQKLFEHQLGLNLDLAGKDFLLECHVFDRRTDDVDELLKRHRATCPVLSSEKIGDFLQLHYTPNYLYFPNTPFNIHDTYPNARRIKYFVVLREPVARAISSYTYHSQLSFERRSFKEVLDEGIAQRKALEACYQSYLGPEAPGKSVGDLPVEQQRKILYQCFWGRQDTHDRTIPETGVNILSETYHAHVDKGIYVDLLRRWFAVLGRQNFFVFSIEEWSIDPVAMYERLSEFSGYQAVGPDGFPDRDHLRSVLSKRANEERSLPVNISQPQAPSHGDVERLRAFYEPYNEDLFKLLGRRLW